MNKFSFNFTIQWLNGKGESILTFVLEYDPAKVNDVNHFDVNHFEEQVKCTMSKALSSTVLRKLFEVKDPLTEIQCNDGLLYGGEKLTISINNNFALLKDLEDNLREGYAINVFMNVYKNASNEFSKFTGKRKIEKVDDGEPYTGQL